MTLSSISFVVFMDPLQGTNDVCLLSSFKICGIFGIRHSKMPYLSQPTSKAYVELTCGETTHIYLLTYIVKSNHGSRETSHTIQSRYASVWNYIWNLVDV
jgi:hypothetical protein